MKFNSSTSFFFCIFLNERNNFEKSCSIEYRLCNQKLTQTVHNTSTSENPNSILLNLVSLEVGTYCYIATAVTNTTTVKVEGELQKGKLHTVWLDSCNDFFWFCFTYTAVASDGNDNLAIILGIIIPFVLLLLISFTIILLVAWRRRRSKYDQHPTEPQVEPVLF